MGPNDRDPTLANWAGNHHYPVAPQQPSSIDDLQQQVRAAVEDRRTIRSLGSRHSFNAIADAEVIIASGGLPETFAVNNDRTIVTVNAGMTYGRFAELATDEGVALRNLASLPHISIGGAIATGTHGSGMTNGNLATEVVGLEVIDETGAVKAVSGDALTTHAVNLGAIGIVTAVSLAVEPAYEVEQRVFNDLDWDAFTENVVEVLGCAYSVSCFTRWNSGIEQVWVKRRTSDPDRSARLLELGTTEATEDQHPIRELDAAACTPQRGVAGLWSDRLPHFRMDFTPSAGEEIQSEFFIALEDAAAGIDALRSVGGALKDTLLISEIRTVAGDGLAMSPCFGRDSLAFHFTWAPDIAGAAAAARIVEDALADLAPRPHWGKVFTPDLTIASRYPDVDRFRSVVRPAFVNEWLRELGV